MSRTHKNLAVAVVLATCTAGLLAGCGDDDDADPVAGTTPDAVVTTDGAHHTVADTVADTAADADDEPTADPVTETTSADPAGIDDIAEFCDAYTEITILMSGEPDPAAIAANVEIVKASAPSEIAAHTSVMTDAVDAVLASNGEDFSAMEAPEFSAAQGEVDPFVFENCEFDGRVRVVGQDYSFDGLPDTIDGGRVALLFTNEGAEAHEIAIMRRNDGVTESFEELLSLPEEQAMEKVTPIGGTFAPTTGTSGLLIGDFEPGDYIAICFIPVGTVMADGAMTEGTGTPHFMHGMQQEFTVTG